MSARFLHGWQNFRLASTGIRETLINTILSSTKKGVYKLHPVVILEKLAVPHLVKQSPHFMETDGSLPHSQQPATCPYPEPPESGPHSPISISVRFILALTSIYAKVFQVISFLSGFTTKTLYVYHYFIRATCPARLVLLDFLARMPITKDLTMQH